MARPKKPVYRKESPSLNETPCRFVNTPGGCREGNECEYSHSRDPDDTPHTPSPGHSGDGAAGTSVQSQNVEVNVNFNQVSKTDITKVMKKLEIEDGKQKNGKDTCPICFEEFNDLESHLRRSNKPDHGLSKDKAKEIVRRVHRSE